MKPRIAEIAAAKHTLIDINYNGSITDDDINDLVQELTRNRHIVNVYMLFVGATMITDGALDYIAELNELTQIELFEIEITDASLRHIASLPKLEYVDISDTKVSPRGHIWLRDKRPGLAIEY